MSYKKFYMTVWMMVSLQPNTINKRSCLIYPQMLIMKNNSIHIVLLFYDIMFTVLYHCNIVIPMNNVYFCYESDFDHHKACFWKQTTGHVGLSNKLWPINKNYLTAIIVHLSDSILEGTHKQSKFKQSVLLQILKVLIQYVVVSVAFNNSMCIWYLWRVLPIIGLPAFKLISHILCTMFDLKTVERHLIHFLQLNYRCNCLVPLILTRTLPVSLQSIHVGWYTKYGMVL